MEEKHFSYMLEAKKVKIQQCNSTNKNSPKPSGRVQTKKIENLYTDKVTVI